MEIVYAYHISAQIDNAEKGIESIDENIFLSEKESLKIDSINQSFRPLIFSSILGDKLKLEPTSYFYNCFNKHKNDLWLLLETLSTIPFLIRCTSRMLSQEKKDEVNKIFDAYDPLQVELCELQKRFCMNDENKWSHFEVSDGKPFIKIGNSLFKLQEEHDVDYRIKNHYKPDIF
jgi:hypothetical protein